ncbi:hypothetical protein DAPPUDRAFT_233876 [Daphnia pulex]|uniref:Uncharacterized protein n=1 Tax=Daphnia pulex TaxID=6669 RepID=E9FW00_DAPPU|nr:hypothetical protein DAPPUDRAFT_233876 [Daphnia pulex]|eukprot:EFX89012.1 hypothetical protein DAPPUDRAFT_233876 [Daphnia pulex]
MVVDGFLLYCMMPCRGSISEMCAGLLTDFTVQVVIEYVAWRTSAFPLAQGIAAANVLAAVHL